MASVEMAKQSTGIDSKIAQLDAGLGPKGARFEMRVESSKVKRNCAFLKRFDQNCLPKISVTLFQNKTLEFLTRKFYTNCWSVYSRTFLNNTQNVITSRVNTMNEFRTLTSIKESFCFDNSQPIREFLCATRASAIKMEGNPVWRVLVPGKEEKLAGRRRDALKIQRYTKHWTPN
jgi:hypothetical protein